MLTHMCFFFGNWRRYFLVYQCSPIGGIRSFNPLKYCVHSHMISECNVTKACCSIQLCIYLTNYLLSFSWTLQCTTIHSNDYSRYFFYNTVGLSDPIECFIALCYNYSINRKSLLCKGYIE